MTDSILHIREFFTSIQGEGIHSGRPMHFIRTSGCNLKCVYCDTLDDDSANVYSVDEIISLVQLKSDLPVYITGGEPLMQENITVLAGKLIDFDYEVHLDTNGSMDIEVLPDKIHKIVDIKTPGSGAGDSFLKSNLGYIAPDDEIKFVVTSRDDFAWITGVIENWKLPDLTGNIIIQPAWGMIDLKELAGMVISCGLPVRMGLQIHKVIWGADARGV